MSAGGGSSTAPGWILTAVVVVLAMVAVVVGVTEPYDGLRITGQATGSDAGGLGTELDAGLGAEVDELIAFVERERGLEFITRPEIVFAPEDEFVEALLRESEADEGTGPGVEEYEHLYRALGWIAPDDDLDEVLDAFLGAGVVGFYITGEDILYVRGAELTPYTRVVLVHELVHALDDQHVDLHRPEYADRLDEVGFGLTALAEGSAMRIENAYRASLSRAERDAVAAEELAGLDGIDPADIPIEIALFQLIPYQEGEVLVEAILAHGGDEAFADPPTTSKQVLRPETYLAREPALEVPPPPADGEILVEGMFGQAAIVVMLYLVVGPRAAEEAGHGWAGDWFVAWEADGRSCVRVDAEMDDAVEADELDDAWQRWARTMPDAEAERLADTLVRLTSCVTIER